MIRTYLDRVSVETMREWLFHLAKDPLPRRTMNYTRPGATKTTLYEADDYLAERLAEWGYTTEREACQVQAYRRDPEKPKHHQYSAPTEDDPWYIAYNLYATRTGTELPDDLIVVISHKDSQSWVENGPGAYDNAVGTVANLELARLLADYEPRRSIWHVWCNEEHTPWTSAVTAQRVIDQGKRLTMALNVDSLGGTSDDDQRPANVSAFTSPEGEALVDLQAELNDRYGIGLHQRKHAREYPNDDDGSFIKAGLPAAIVMVGSFPYVEPNYHLDSDRPENVDFDAVRRCTQLALATILEVDARD